MTSTKFNVGLGDGSRSSSRVLRPPGGGHTNIFGGEPEPIRGRRAAPAPTSMIGHQEPDKPTNGTIPEPMENNESHPEEYGQKQEEPLEAEVAEVKPVASVAEKPQRVRVPPGGFSSKLW